MLRECKILRNLTLPFVKSMLNAALSVSGCHLAADELASYELLANYELASYKLRAVITRKFNTILT